MKPFLAGLAVAALVFLASLPLLRRVLAPRMLPPEGYADARAALPWVEPHPISDDPAFPYAFIRDAQGTTTPPFTHSRGPIESRVLFALHTYHCDECSAPPGGIIFKLADPTCATFWCRNRHVRSFCPYTLP